MRVILVALVLMTATVAAAPPIDPAGKRIVGEWRGTSLCTNLKLAPNCKNETVRYVFTGPIGGKNAYHVSADKLVGKVYEPMGDLDFAYSTAESVWTSPLESPRCPKCKWWFRLKGPDLIGGLTQGDADTVRKAAAKRHKP